MSGNKQEPLEKKKTNPSPSIYRGKKEVHENQTFSCSNVLSCRQQYSAPNSFEIAQ
jgi:hypothetical protein